MIKYYCINNGFNPRLKIDYTTEYIIKDSALQRYGRPVSYNIYCNENNKLKYVGNFELYAYQNFDDYFISKAEWREKQINSIFEE